MDYGGLQTAVDRRGHCRNPLIEKGLAVREVEQGRRFAEPQLRDEYPLVWFAGSEVPDVAQSQELQRRSVAARLPVISRQMSSCDP